MIKCVDCNNTAPHYDPRCSACQPAHERRTKIEELIAAVNAECDYQPTPTQEAVLWLLENA